MFAATDVIREYPAPRNVRWGITALWSTVSAFAVALVSVFFYSLVRESSEGLEMVAMGLMLATPAAMLAAIILGEFGRICSFKAWAQATQPDEQVLARLAIAPNQLAWVRTTAMQLLDGRNPSWRVQHANNVPLPSSSQAAQWLEAVRANVPSERPDPSIGFACLMFGVVLASSLFMVGFIADVPDHAAIVARIMKASGVGGIFMMLGMTLMLRHSKKVTALDARLKSALLGRYSFVELLTIQALPGLSDYQRQSVQTVLNEAHPGWEQSPQVPLWSLACIC